jgi:hypothetical protein
MGVEWLLAASERGLGGVGFSRPSPLGAWSPDFNGTEVPRVLKHAPPPNDQKSFASLFTRFSRDRSSFEASTISAVS